MSSRFVILVFAKSSLPSVELDNILIAFFFSPSPFIHRPNCARSSQILDGHRVRNRYSSPLPYTYIKPEDLPDSFSWGNVDGVSYLTKSLNQHIPQVRCLGARVVHGRPRLCFSGPLK